jgi:phosphatidylglycerol:prolipoprotein diacylglycerol transferase
MYPEIAGVSVYYPVLAVGVVAAIVASAIVFRGAGYPPQRIVLYLLAIFVPGMLGAKLYSILLHGGLRGADVELAGGLRYPGALLGLMLGGYFMRGLLPKGLGFARFADLFAPCFAIALAVGRVACLLKGCCYGSVSSLPWAFRYPRGSIPWHAHLEAGGVQWWSAVSLPVHPLPLYFLLLEVGLVALLFWFVKRRAYDGQVALLFLALHGTGKFALEQLRAPYHPLHQGVVVLAVPAIGVLAWRWFRRGRFVAAPSAAGGA